MANRSRVGKAVRIVLYVVVILLLVAAIGVVFKFTNGGKESFKTFYLVYDGQDIMSSENSMYFEPEKVQRFEVRYLFGDTEKAQDYNVSIVPNPDANFKFTADGLNYRWCDVGEISEFFGLSKDEDSFSFTVPSDPSPKRILERIFPDKEIVVEAAKVFEDSFLYKLIVTSSDGEFTYGITFSSFVEAESFDLNVDHVCFWG